ncbi:hypothetical protein M422DRAFT_252636 [Sphaerobolus stellatus SS14]|uniref:Chromatin assembly factor 1 subunit A dimerization domain-containing protein n=1 Tax=Sphaerobolus stellatus (strain SS14) TaxID=990650 RepID=A0A0C9UM45_SPHS4|nr:hypothetical protein M422DRAFT_252636 [Sphaerobolus stellatus SS14]
MHQLNEAEVQGDQPGVRRLTALLKNREKLPAKFLIFAENVRPGYLGTWTRPSPYVTPRKPLACDLISFDYAYDSDAEWEQGENGEDVDTLDDSMDEDEASSVASDLDGWLVEGDEVEEESELPLSPTAGIKRKALINQESQNKKRKIVPLIPYQKGPLWETEIGQTDYQPFMSMRIQLFNDTTFPIDPFAYVLPPVGPDIGNTTKNETVFAVPALPARVADFSSTTEESKAKRKGVNPAPPPKTSFPDAHVPLLLDKIRTSSTFSFVVLLDLIFQDMKTLGIKKNALEVKIREVAEKNKAKKNWVVKDSAWTQYGLPIPPSTN